MKRIILELKRYIISPIFLIAVLAALGIMIYPLRDSLKMIFAAPRASYLYYVEKVHALGTFDLFAPAIAAIPFGAAFYNDFKSGYGKFILTRTSRSEYLISKALSCGITGGLAIFLPNLTLDVFLWSFARPQTVSDNRTFPQENIAELEGLNGGLNLMLILLALAFLFGAAWALAGLAVSAFIPNKFAAYASPFMIYFASSLILAQNEETLKFSPINMLYPNYRGIPSLAFCFIYQSILIIAAAATFVIRADRRLRNDL